MPTDRISPSSPLLETLRAMARDRAKGVGAGIPSAGTAASDTQGAATPRSVKAIGELRLRLRELACTVDVEDAQSIRDARKPALREILLWEFGSDFRQDPQFLPMLDAIGHALDADPGFQQRFVDLITGLRKA